MRAHVLAFGLLGSTILGCATVRVKYSEMFQGNIILVLENAEFDGHSLSGRLLVGSADGRRKIDLSVWPFQGINTQSAQKCDSSEEISLYVRDGGRIASQGDMSCSIYLFPGYWYGSNVNVLVSPEDAVTVECVVLEAML